MEEVLFNHVGAHVFHSNTSLPCFFASHCETILNIKAIFGAIKIYQPVALCPLMRQYVDDIYIYGCLFNRTVSPRHAKFTMVDVFIHDGPWRVVDKSNLTKRSTVFDIVVMFHTRWTRTNMSQQNALVRVQHG